MNTLAIRLGARHQSYLFAVGTLLVLSGALWLLFHYSAGCRESSAMWRIRWSPGGCARTVSAAAFLIGFGSVLPGHVRRAWVGRRNRLSGTRFFSVLALLIVSGYALYYMGDEDLRTIVSVLHWVIGLGAPLLMAWHVWRGQVQRSLHGKTDGGREPVEKSRPAPAVIRLQGKR